MEISGRTALVTGGASGLGLATTELIVQRGANVVILDLPSSAGTAVAERLGRSVRFSAGNVTSGITVAFIPVPAVPSATLTVCHAAPLRALGLGINLLPHAVAELDRLGLAQELSRIAAAPSAICYYRADGTLAWVESKFKQASETSDPARTEFLCVIRDVTERKRMEDELTQLNRRLTQLAATDGLRADLQSLRDTSLATQLR